MVNFNLALVTLLATASSVQGAGESQAYTYFEEGGIGRKRWPFLTLPGNECGTTGGTSGYGQSPIAIGGDADDVDPDTCQTTAKNYQFFEGQCTFDDLTFGINNNGVIVSPTNGCMFGKMGLPYMDKDFNAAQFHIHTGSEHTVFSDGMPAPGDQIGTPGSWPAELHVVHLEDVEGGVLGRPDTGGNMSAAVFGLMMESVDTPHETFEWFLRGWEKVAKKYATECAAAPSNAIAFTPLVDGLVDRCGATPADYVDPVCETSIAPCDAANPATPIDLYTDLPALGAGKTVGIDSGFWTYKGGLTTPGCNELVNWNVNDVSMKISTGQMARLERLIMCAVGQSTDSDDNLESCFFKTVANEAGSTSRLPQPKKGRAITHRCGEATTTVAYTAVTDIGQAPDDTTEFVKPAAPMEPSNADSSPKCSKSMWESCSDDPRYNPKVSPNLRTGSDVWNNMAGYWVGKMNKYDFAGEPLAATFDNGEVKNTLPYPQDEVDVFINVTVVETRVYRHVYQIFNKASASFCERDPTAGASNVRGNGICGQSGYALSGSKFGVATFEKDGSADIVAATGQFDGTGSESGSFVPVDEDTLYSVIRAASFEQTETSSFTNEGKTRISGAGQLFVNSAFPPYSLNPLAESYTYEVNQVSMADFTSALSLAQAENAVPPADKVGSIIEGNCNEGAESCPTEEELGKSDPKFQSTIYDDDDNMKGGFIALWVILGSLCCFGVLFGVHIHRMNSQADRYKHQFARRIAQTIEFDGTHEKLTPEALEKEFAKMDADGSGSVDKAELKEFMGEKMSDRDFEAMFAAIDLDHNGTLDFAEFCAFMAQIGAVYDEEAKSNKA